MYHRLVCLYLYTLSPHLIADHPLTCANMCVSIVHCSRDDHSIFVSTPINLFQVPGDNGAGPTSVFEKDQVVTMTVDSRFMVSSFEGTSENRVLASYYTLYTPCIHLYCRICTYVHPLYMFSRHIYIIYTPNTPLNTLYTP